MKQKVKARHPLSIPPGSWIAATALFLGIVEAPLAASSDWIQTEGGRVRVTALAPDETGVIHGVLDIDLLPGWKTYWRDPGDTGVPPSIDIGDSENIDQVSLEFPAPERVNDGYSIWAGYTYPVALPMTLRQDQPGKPSQIEADVFLGICETICIPFQARFSLQIEPDHQPNDFEVALVEDAHALIPEKPGEDLAVSGAVLSEDESRLTLSVLHPLQQAATDLFISGPIGWYFGIPERVESDEGASVFTVAIVARPEGRSLSGQPLRLLVKTTERSMETEIEIP